MPAQIGLVPSVAFLVTLSKKDSGTKLEHLLVSYQTEKPTPTLNLSFEEWGMNHIYNLSYNSLILNDTWQLYWGFLFVWVFFYFLVDFYSWALLPYFILFRQHLSTFKLIWLSIKALTDFLWSVGLCPYKPSLSWKYGKSVMHFIHLPNIIA